MCSHYQAEKRRALLERRFGALPPKGLKSSADEHSHVYPTQFAPIIRRPAERDSGDEAVPDFEMVDARFGLLPTFAKDVKYGTRTYNARSETAASLPSFKTAWAKPRHCIVPCEAIYEPDWRTGTHVPTRFTASNDGTLGVAGLWQPWRASTGEWVDTFTMLTLNADGHDLMKHYHRPDATRPPDMQDKRMVVILPEGLFEAWLDAPAANSHDFMRQFPADRLVATPEPMAAKVRSIKVKPTQEADQGGLF